MTETSIGVPVGADSVREGSRTESAAPTGARTNHGFTLWELMVVIALVVFLFIAAAENLLPLRGKAERSTVVAMVGNLQSAMGMESVRRAMTGGKESLDAMAGANPMEWLAVRPANYLGAIDSGLAGVPPGYWVYSAKSGILFYRVRYPEYFKGSFVEPPGLRFRIVAERNTDGTLDNVRLERLDAGVWITDGSEIGRWLGEDQ